MIEMVVALCLFIIEGDEAKLKEHYHYSTVSECLAARRIGQRNTSPEDIILQCDKVMAETRIDESGEEPRKTIIRIIKD
jgi:hypothetical protein|tara:strand:+ start:245 stop:481 length:237 start_codon:yes stop_codon:yes gene_type:complete